LPCCHVHLRGQKPVSPAYPRELRTLGDHLRKRRLNLGLLQREAAKRLEVNTATVTNWELGHSTPEFRSLPAILDFLGYDPRPQPGTVGQALKRYRQGQGMSQEDLAGLLSIDPSTLAKWEREDRVPAGRYLQRVERLLKPSPTLLFRVGGV
jgi:transcriptional regulator with XRE-family HTH domain